jgi:hypothetical protein
MLTPDVERRANLYAASVVARASSGGILAGRASRIDAQARIYLTQLRFATFFKHLQTILRCFQEIKSLFHPGMANSFHRPETSSTMTGEL